jgi:hypothetical protein
MGTGKRKASYEDAVMWIAHNDDPGDREALNEDSVSDLTTVRLVADIFQRDSLQVGRDVVKERQKARDEEG